MNRPIETQPIGLAPAGAGLPGPEAFVLRHVGVPMLGAILPWRYALRRFHAEGERILALGMAIPAAQRTTPMLVRRLMAMEDSSRCWSVAMVARHLTVVGGLIADIVVDLSQGRVSSHRVDIAAVKPGLDTRASAMDEFRAFLDHFRERVASAGPHRRGPSTHPHPWVGALNAHQWLCLGAIHQGLHRRQASMIIRRLKKGGHQ